jgi:hypothetical protein
VVAARSFLRPQVVRFSAAASRSRMRESRIFPKKAVNAARTTCTPPKKATNCSVRSGGLMCNPIGHERGMRRTQEAFLIRGDSPYPIHSFRSRSEGRAHWQSSKTKSLRTQKTWRRGLRQKLSRRSRQEKAGDFHCDRKAHENSGLPPLTAKYGEEYTGARMSQNRRKASSCNASRRFREPPAGGRAHPENRACIRSV